LEEKYQSQGVHRFQQNATTTSKLQIDVPSYLLAFFPTLWHWKKNELNITWT
jgi:hypothetical protein